MRVNPDHFSEIGLALNRAQANLNTAVNQLSSGKRVTSPSDDPVSFASNVRTIANGALVDSYKQNASSVLAQTQSADAALSSVVSLLTQAVGVGVQGGNGTESSSQKTAAADQVQGILESVVGQANSTWNGQALFSGTAATASPFAADPAAPGQYSYLGNSTANVTAVTQTLSVSVGVPGDSIFLNASGNVIGSLQTLVSALRSGATEDIASAVANVTSAIQHVDQVRAVYGNTQNQISSAEDYLSQESVLLSSQENSLTGVDLAQAATNLTQTQTAQTAVFAMAAKVLPVSLLNFLQN